MGFLDLIKRVYVSKVFASFYLSILVLSFGPFSIWAERAFVDLCDFGEEVNELFFTSEFILGDFDGLFFGERFNIINELYQTIRAIIKIG